MMDAQCMNVLIKILSQCQDWMLAVILEHTFIWLSHTAMAFPVLLMMPRKNLHVWFALVEQQDYIIMD